jgi:MFS family permease
MNLLRKVPVYYGWWILASSVLIIFVSGMAGFGLPAYYPSFIETFGWSRTKIALSYTILNSTSGGMALLWGSVIDKRGVRLVLTIGTVCAGLGYLLFTQMTALWQLYAIVVLFGTGYSSMGYLPNQLLQARWFVLRRGLAVGTVNAASALGGVSTPVLITFLIARVGWRNTIGLIDILIWIIPLLLIVFVIRESPIDLNLQADGAKTVATPEMIAIRKQSRHSMGAKVKNFRGVLMMPTFWFIIAAVFFAGGTVGTTLQLLIIYLRDSGFTPQTAATALSLELGVSFFGRLVFGALSDRFSALKVGVVGFTLLGLSPLLLFFVHVPSVWIGFSVLHGLGHGSIVSFHPLMFAEAFGTEKYIGKLLAIGHLVYSNGVGMIPVIVAYTFDNTGSYSFGFAFNVVMTLLSAVGLIAIGRHWRRMSTIATPILSS